MILLEHPRQSRRWTCDWKELAMETIEEAEVEMIHRPCWLRNGRSSSGLSELDLVVGGLGELLCLT
jgi:hypothetical protein